MKKEKSKEMIGYTAKGLIWYAVAEPIIKDAIKFKRDIPHEVMQETMNKTEQIVKCLIGALTKRKQGIVVINNELVLINER